jgi:alkaline phosphatase D
MSMPSAAISPAAQLTRVGFGSCFKEGDDMSIWDEISHENPDLFVFLGDNVYGDNYPDDAEFTDPEMPKMQRSYAKLSDSMTFARFRSKTPMLFTWDDHDYGVNDGGADYPFREKAQELFLDAWNIPANDPRRSRPGIYSSETFGPEGERVQFILLDTRYFRGPLTKTDEYNAKGKERYVPSGNASSTMLGETQWAWLEDELRKPADVRFLISSVQVIADGHGWEAWKMLPHERNRLYKVLRDTGAANTVLISGDRHAGAHYKRDDVTGFPLYEMTTSSLNAPVSKWKKPGDTYVEPGPHRITAMQDEVNYGMADIDWSAREVNLRLVNPGGETWTQTVPF